MEVRELRILSFFLIKNSFLILELFATLGLRANLELFTNFDGTKKPTSEFWTFFYFYYQYIAAKKDIYLKKIEKNVHIKCQMCQQKHCKLGLKTSFPDSLTCIFGIMVCRVVKNSIKV